MENFLTAQAFLFTVALIPVIGFLAVKVIGMMLSGELDVLPGTIVVSLGILVLGLSARSDTALVPIVSILLIVTATLLYPFAVDQLDRQDLRSFQIERLERAHEELHARPENIVALFEAAQILFDLGLRGSAILIAESALAMAPKKTSDPAGQPRRQDLFHAEAMMVRRWREDKLDPREFGPTNCPACGHPNEPGGLACARCKEPYLLLMAREATGSKSVVGRLVVSFAVVCALLVGVTWASVTFDGPLLWLLSIVGFGAVAAILILQFRPSRPGRI